MFGRKLCTLFIVVLAGMVNSSWAQSPETPSPDVRAAYALSPRLNGAEWRPARPSASDVRDDNSPASSLSVKQNLAMAYYMRGVAYQKKGDLDKAIADFTAAIKLGSEEGQGTAVAGSSGRGPTGAIGGGAPWTAAPKPAIVSRELAPVRPQFGQIGAGSRTYSDAKLTLSVAGRNNSSQPALAVEGGTRFGDQHVMTVGLPGDKGDNTIGLIPSATVDPLGGGHTKIIVAGGSVDFGRYNSLGNDAHGGLLFSVANDPEAATAFVPAMRIYAPRGRESPRVTVNQAKDDGTSAFQVKGKTSLDGGHVTTDGLGTLCLHPQETPPKPVKGGIYFDGTSFHFCTDGETWRPLRLSINADAP